MNKIGKEQVSQEEDEDREIDNLIDKMNDPLKLQAAQITLKTVEKVKESVEQSDDGLSSKNSLARREISTLLKLPIEQIQEVNLDESQGRLLELIQQSDNKPSIDFEVKVIPTTMDQRTLDVQDLSPGNEGQQNATPAISFGLTKAQSEQIAAKNNIKAEGSPILPAINSIVSSLMTLQKED